MNPTQKKWSANGERYRVTCIPLTDLLKALEVKHVDYFSLDTQGGELKILKTIDFRAIHIDIVIIEVEGENKEALEKNRAQMRQFFKETGIYKEGVLSHDHDLMFERMDLVV